LADRFGMKAVLQVRSSNMTSIYHIFKGRISDSLPDLLDVIKPLT
jgi:hypothetical protein